MLRSLYRGMTGAAEPTPEMPEEQDTSSISYIGRLMMLIASAGTFTVITIIDCGKCLRI